MEIIPRLAGTSCAGKTYGLGDSLQKILYFRCYCEDFQVHWVLVTDEEHLNEPTEQLVRELIQ